MEMITRVCQSIVVLPEHQAICHSRISQWTSSRSKALSISGRISSQPAAFTAFSVLTTRKTSVAVMEFSSPKCTWCLSGDVILARTKDSLKYSLHLPRMSASLLSKAAFWYLMDPAVWNLLPRRRRMVCHKTLLQGCRVGVEGVGGFWVESDS